MTHRTAVADRRGLILDFAGSLTAGPIDVHRAWCVSEGLAPGANPYEHVGTRDLFDVHVVSEPVGMSKPDPAIYELAL